ncbi:MAG: hypothetical protein ACI82F_002907 [Planctomycetota bacterium]|jgi:hypothetical protein
MWRRHIPRELNEYVEYHNGPVLISRLSANRRCTDPLNESAMCAPSLFSLAFTFGITAPAEPASPFCSFTVFGRGAPAP